MLTSNSVSSTLSLLLWFSSDSFYSKTNSVVKHNWKDIKYPGTRRQFLFITRSFCDYFRRLNPGRVCICLKTSNNQRLRSAGDNDRRSKRFCSIDVLCVSFPWQVVKTRLIRLGVIEGPNARHQVVFFCVFYSVLVEVQTDAGYIYATYA